MGKEPRVYDSYGPFLDALNKGKMKFITLTKRPNFQLKLDPNSIVSMELYESISDKIFTKIIVRTSAASAAEHCCIIETPEEIECMITGRSIPKRVPNYRYVVYTTNTSTVHTSNNKVHTLCGMKITPFWLCEPAGNMRPTCMECVEKINL